MAESDAESRFAAYSDALRREVCRTCLDGRGDGTCGLTNQECPLDAQLPAVIAAVQGIHSNNLDDYTKAVEDQVCSHCSNRPARGCCESRERPRLCRV